MEIKTTLASAVSPQIRQTLDKALLPDTPNLYLTRKANAVLAVPVKLSSLQSYSFPTPISFHSGTLPLKSFLQNPKTKFAIESTGVISDYGGKFLAGTHADTASALQGVSVFVGAYGCIDRMMKLEKFGRTRQVFCFADLALAILMFLGRYVPQLNNVSMGFLGVKTLVKLGDKYVECTYSAREAEGKALLKMVQNPDKASEPLAQP